MPEEKAEGKKDEKKPTTTVLVHDEGKKEKKAFPFRTVLMYFLILAAGLFIGIVFRLATR